MADNLILDDQPEQFRTVLRVEAPALDIQHRDEFAQAFNSLLNSDHERIVVDLQKIDRIFSLFIGSLVDLHQRSNEVGKRLQILVSPGVHETFKRMNLLEALDIDTP